MKPWRRDGSRPSSSLLKHKDDHSDRHHDQEKRNYHENDDRHHKSSRGERDKDHYQHVDKYSERQRSDPRDERDSNRNRPISGDNSPRIVSEKEPFQSYRNQRDRYYFFSFLYEQQSISTCKVLV